MTADLVTLLFLLAFVLWGAKRGAVRMLTSALGLAASVILGFVLYRPIASVLENMGIADGLTAKLVENIDKMINLPGVMRDVMNVTGAENEFARSVAGAALSLVSFLAVVLLVRAVLLVVNAVLGTAGSLPVIKQSNRMLGGIAGFVIGAVAAFLIFGIIAAVEIFSGADIADDIFRGSFLASLLYDNNPLLGLLIK